MKRLFAFWEDYAERESQIKDGLGKFVEACVEAIVPPVVVLTVIVMTAIHIGVPHHPVPWLILLGLTIAYGAWWLPYCRGKALDQLPKILGREPTEALGDARWGDREDASELGYDGSRGGIYVGRWRVE